MEILQGSPFLNGCQLLDCINMTGFRNVWQLQENVPIGIAKLVRLKLTDNYKQEWLKSVFDSL